MSRIQMMTNRLADSFASLGRRLPSLGTSPTYAQSDTESTPIAPAEANRNRWSRSDLVSAIGRDPSVTDPAVQVWPPREEPGYSSLAAQPTSCCQSCA